MALAFGAPFRLTHGECIPVSSAIRLPGIPPKISFIAFGVVASFRSRSTSPASSRTQYQLDRSPRSRPTVSLRPSTFPILCAAAVLLFFIAGLLYLLRFERVDNLGAYRIPPETGLLIPSVYNSQSGRETLRGHSQQKIGSGTEIVSYFTSRSMSHETTKYRIVHFLQKYLFNPPIKFLFAIGLVRPGYALLETTGRKSGKQRRTPVGDGLVGNQFWIIAEHGHEAGYVLNIAANPHVRLKLRDGLRSRWHTGKAHLLSDDDPRERQRWLAKQLPSSASNSALVRFFGTQLLTIRIDLEN